MKIELTREARKQLRKIAKPEISRIIKKLRILEESPLAGKKLKGKLKNRYSLKAWPYRIIYVITKKSVQIDNIEHRKSVYR